MRYRVWHVELPECRMRISVKPAITEEKMRETFGIPDDAKAYPILDNRMKNGGKET